MTANPRTRVGVARFSWTKLEAIRTTRGLQWKTIAKNAGISDESIRLWHKGRSLPSPAVLHRLADSLGVTSLDLMDGSPADFSLADYRDMAGYSGVAAARLLGMQKVRVNQLEHRATILSDSDAVKLAELYGISEQTVRDAYKRGRS